MDPDPHETRRRYDETVDMYERRYSEIQREKYPRALNLLDFSPTDTVLDWGCGTCLVLPMLEREDINYFGLDFSLPMLQRARCRNAPNLVLGDCTRIPFRGRSFDRILGVTVIQNVASPGKALGELSRVLKKGGKSVISYPKRARVSLPEFENYGFRLLERAEINEDQALLLQLE